MKTLVVIAHNIRSTHNVGSIFRTCDGFGVAHLYLSGYTPYPLIPGDERLPHITAKLDTQIHKTALGAETQVPFSYHSDIFGLLTTLHQQEFAIVALEQSDQSVLLPDFVSPEKTALLLGEEVEGITDDLLALADHAIEIPMKGHKESFNVSVAFGIAAYALTT